MRAFERLADNEAIHSDFRLIVATHRGLRTEIDEGNFREDLYFRVMIFTIALPALRSRRQDIVPLAEQ
jgi:DNA-binding NtrC family response regulator